jgi:hypothetical protein
MLTVQDLAQEVERGGVDENALALPNQRFEEYIQGPGQTQPLYACLARLAVRLGAANRASIGEGRTLNEDRQLTHF